ncbi:RHS repeat-associated core domain-containing protein, partial [Pseudomonas sp. PCH199]|uniref:RHS repeat-associated core domain-containing protein n=1 Tax=unclassified Pseudomonas TaxID=196821 RepID=UPI00114102C0
MQLLPQTVLCSYGYDSLDRLTSHTLPGSSERQLFYCRSRLSTEIEDALHHSIFQHGDQLLAENRSESGARVTSLLATDLQRSVLATLNANQQRQLIAHSPYGNRPPENAFASLLGFNGERPDPVTGSYLLGNGYRAFYPWLMRFGSPDSLSPFENGGFNSYAYCLGDPVNQIDPTGNVPIFLSRVFRTLTHRIENWRVNKLINESDKISKLMNQQK